MLKELLTNEPALPLSIDASAREVITEVGNILLNACLGTFGNLLKVQVSFSVPQLSLETMASILASLRVEHEGVRYALVVHAGFKLARRRGPRLPGDRPERRVARPPDSRRRRLGAASTVTSSLNGAIARPVRRARSGTGSRSCPTAAFSSPTRRSSSDVESSGSKRRRASPAPRPFGTAVVRALSEHRRPRPRSVLSGRPRTGEVRVLSERFHKFLLPISRNLHGHRPDRDGADGAHRAADGRATRSSARSR